LPDPGTEPESRGTDQRPSECALSSDRRARTDRLRSCRKYGLSQTLMSTQRRPFPRAPAAGKSFIQSTCTGWSRAGASGVCFALASARQRRVLGNFHLRSRSV